MAVNFDSKEEEWIYNSLKKFKLDFFYHYEIFGGSLLRGGIIVDYAVWRPMLTPFEYFGPYWHAGQLGVDDKLKLIAEEQYFGQPPIVAYGSDIFDQQSSDDFVRQNVL